MKGQLAQLVLEGNFIELDLMLFPYLGKEGKGSYSGGC